jgi:DNA-binding transcriptional MocR family regulator
MLGLMAGICPDAYLLVDETYRDAAYGNDAAAPTLAGFSPKVITTSSLSKCHGTPGLRIGWAITTDPALRQQFVVAKFNTTVSCSPLDEALALHVLEQHDRLIAERRPQLTNNLQATADWVARNARYVDWVRPDAGALCCIRLKPGISIDRFRALSLAAGVRFAEGPWFGDEERVFRLGFGLLKPADYAAALGILSDVLPQAAG